MPYFLCLLFYGALVFADANAQPKDVAPSFFDGTDVRYWANNTLYKTRVKCPANSYRLCLNILIAGANNISREASNSFFYASTSVEMSDCSMTNVTTPCNLTYKVQLHLRLWVHLVTTILLLCSCLFIVSWYDCYIPRGQYDIPPPEKNDEFHLQCWDLLFIFLLAFVFCRATLSRSTFVTRGVDLTTTETSNYGG